MDTTYVQIQTNKKHITLVVHTGKNKLLIPGERTQTHPHNCPNIGIFLPACFCILSAGDVVAYFPTPGVSGLVPLTLHRAKGRQEGRVAFEVGHVNLSDYAIPLGHCLF